jgi:glycosyltransferase involved in cell wall biosynthesis
MTRIAALLVTKDAERWLPSTLASIREQTRAADDLVAVDDGSTDGTRSLLESAGFRVVDASTTSTDVTTRIAQNFVQGVRACEGADLVVLGDHDDVWHLDRIAHQAGVLEVWEQALMIASDGMLVGAGGELLGGTLRAAFPVPGDWDDLTPATRMRTVLRTSVATGGASAIRPAAFPTLDVPEGWLHDRWWSLVATGCNGMLVDRRPVIDYRVQPEQQLGLDSGAQQRSGLGRLGSLLGQGRRARSKARDLRERLRPLITDPEVAAVVSLRNVL